MKLVLDNNVLFSLMNPFSITSYLFSSINAEFIAPKFIKSEFDKYKELILSKSGLSEHEFEIREKEIFNLVEFSEESKYRKFLEEAINNLPDSKDSPYLALALTFGSKIWSNDPHFKEQKLVPVFSTSELIIKFLHGEV